MGNHLAPSHNEASEERSLTEHETLPARRLDDGETPMGYRRLAPPPIRDRRHALISAAVLVVGALISCFVLGTILTNPESFAGTMAALDEKKNTVMKLMAASTGSSAAISLLPGDAGTPIAEKLVDLSSDFLVVLAAIYLEKYLLTIMGFASFRVLVPIGMLMFSVMCMIRDERSLREILFQLGVKLVTFGISVFLVVPVSVFVSGMIESTYEASITQTLETAEQTTDAIENSAEQGESSNTSDPLSFLLNMPDELNKLTESAQNSLSNFIEALAVMIVTSCIIPLLVLLFFVWLARTLLGIEVTVPLRRPGTLRRTGKMRR